MRNKVEILRAIEFTKDDLENIINLNEDIFTDKDREFMEEFKKVYELGLNQLELFINKLDKEGGELDEYSIQYYVRCLLNGPLSQYARKLSEGKKYFSSYPNTMGMSGNVQITNANTAIIKDTAHPLGVSVDIFNKLPIFLQSQIATSTAKTEEIFRSGMKSSLFMDNTMQIANKNPQLRYDTEASGEWQKKSHGSYCVCDVGFKNILQEINKQVFDKVKKYLGDENYRIFLDNKTYSAFDVEKNTSTSSNYVFKRILKQGEDIDQEVEVDILGSIHESIERREAVLKIENEDKTVEYKLNASQGQLGIK